MPTTSGCPVCASTDLAHLHTFSTTQSAAHLIPPHRSAERNRALERELRRLWGSDRVDVLRCRACGFGFADPYVAGTAEIYNLIGAGDQHYPADRFEFGQTLGVLRERGGVGRLLEIGAGSGAFLRRVIDESLAKTITATEYDDSAVARLRGLPGVTVVQDDVQVLARDEDEPYDAVCAFQVLEHMDRLDEVFAAFGRLVAGDGDLFIAVPNSERTTVQERLTRFMDMPPVHIGRWTDQAMATVAGRHGFELVDRRLDPRPAPLELWGLAKYRLEARTRRARGLVARVEGIGLRPLRGVLKRAMAVAELAVLTPHLGRIPPWTRWFHLRRRVAED